MTHTTKQRIAAIVLAAGGSTRLGSPKQLLPYAGEPLVRRAANAALKAGVEEVIVVLGSHADSVKEALRAIPQIRTIMNENWSTGLASSLAVGLSIVSESSDAFLVTVVDQPFVDSAALSDLIERFDDNHRIIASSYVDAVGVPAVFGKEYIPELSELTGDHGAGRWIGARLANVTIVPLEAAAIDVDTPADAALLEEL